MLVERNVEIQDSSPTTVLDAGMQEKDGNEDSDREDGQITPTVDQEGYTGRSKPASTTSPTGSIDQALIDEFIFTNKEKAAQKSSADTVYTNCCTFALLLTTITLLLF